MHAWSLDGSSRQRGSSSGLNSIPVMTFGKKYVDFGGMLTPSAATALTCVTGVGRRKNPRSYSPLVTRSMPSCAERA